MKIEEEEKNVRQSKEREEKEEEEEKKGNYVHYQKKRQSITSSANKNPFQRLFSLKLPSQLAHIFFHFRLDRNNDNDNNDQLKLLYKNNYSTSVLYTKMKCMFILMLLW